MKSSKVRNQHPSSHGSDYSAEAELVDLTKDQNKWFKPIPPRNHDDLTADNLDLHEQVHQSMKNLMAAIIVGEGQLIDEKPIKSFIRAFVRSVEFLTEDYNSARARGNQILTSKVLANMRLEFKRVFDLYKIPVQQQVQILAYYDSFMRGR